MGASPVKMTVRWHVPLGESRVVTEALHRIMVDARQQRGCLGCTVITDAGQQVGVRYVEEWASEEWLRQELRSDRFSTLAALMESASEPPVVEFALPTGIQGLEYVEHVRARGPGRTRSASGDAQERH
jgi:quinol monooxygenase YgiN